ncbi:MAG: hypothetical protein M3173_06355 [Chloroflexota bacterium]|nr:hypothetical protein [Chloroflexota bacterium]
MDSRDIVVVGMCAVMILIGATVMRVSRRDRAMGAVGIALGTIALIAYFAGDEEASPEPQATPWVVESTRQDIPASPTIGP